VGGGGPLFGGGASGGGFFLDNVRNKARSILPVIDPGDVSVFSINVSSL
jgi:hypothetical protein